MTKHELDKLLQLVKAEAKALKTATATRAAQVLADFEQKISKRYCVNESPVWAKLFNQAREIVRELNEQIVTDLESQDIPEEYAPQAEIGWMSRGENAIGARCFTVNVNTSAAGSDHEKAKQMVATMNLVFQEALDKAQRPGGKLWKAGNA
jgi:hypothetical protein